MKTWFKTGLKMSDGTDRTVCAIDDAQVRECEGKGWERVSTAPVAEPKVVVETKTKNITKTKRSKDK